jgi:hypothetical protein
LGTKLSLLPGSPEENQAPEYQSKKTLRRKSLGSKAVALSTRGFENLLSREESFRDDRTSLPSQMGQGNLSSPMSKAP